jgi:hypothetical protein
MERDLTALMHHVQRLGPTEHREIFNIISHHDIIRYMQNNNGIFVDLTTIPDDVLLAIHKFVDYCYNNNGHLDEYNNRLVECKINQNYARLPSLADNTLQSSEGSEIPDLPYLDPTSEDFGRHIKTPSIHQTCQDNLSVANEETILRTAQFGFLSSVTKRMTSSKFNQAKKKFAKKKVTKMELRGDLVKEDYIDFE